MLGRSGFNWLRSNFKCGNGSLGLFEVGRNTGGSHEGLEVCSRIWRSYCQLHVYYPAIEVASQSFPLRDLSLSSKTCSLYLGRATKSLQHAPPRTSNWLRLTELRKPSTTARQHAETIYVRTRVTARNMRWISLLKCELSAIAIQQLDVEAVDTVALSCCQMT
jgi:hypothetical protein